MPSLLASLLVFEGRITFVYIDIHLEKFIFSMSEGPRGSAQQQPLHHSPSGFTGAHTPGASREVSGYNLEPFVWVDLAGLCYNRPTIWHPDS